jgi:hypothetical protein
MSIQFAPALLISLPNIPRALVFVVFVLLVVLLVQKEVLRQLGKPVSHRWTVASNTLIITLLALYGFFVLSKFISLLA